MGPAKIAGGAAGHGCLVHGHIYALGLVAEFEAGAGHGGFKGEAAAQQKPHHVRLNLVQHVGRFARVGDAVAVDAVAGGVGAQVGAGGEVGGFEAAGRNAFEQGAGDRIGFAKGLEVVGCVGRQHDDVGLHVAVGQAGGGAAPLA